MQATCEKCGKTITPKDFSAGHYFLFWVTPTVPSESLYLCEGCRGISWAEREALFNIWWERHEAGPASKRKARPAKSRKTATRQKKQRTSSRKPKSQSPWEDPEYRSKELSKLAQQALALS